MGILIVMVLLLKRTYESPKRRMRIWIYDIVKQLGGSFVIHMLNIMLSVWKNDSVECIGRQNDDDDDATEDDECDWYFVNLLMDTTLGIPILYYILHGIETLGMKCHITNIKSGDYFDAETEHHSTKQEGRRRNPKFHAFLKQFGIFIIALIGMKFIIYVILNYMVSVAYFVANLVIGWSDPWPNFQVFLVMFVCPLLLNCFQYYCIDNIIKLHDTSVNALNWDSFEPTLEEQLQLRLQEPVPEHVATYGSVD